MKEDIGFKNSMAIGELTEKEYKSCFRHSINRANTIKNHPLPWEVVEYDDYVQAYKFTKTKIVDANGNTVIGNVEIQADVNNYDRIVEVINCCGNNDADRLRILMDLGQKAFNKKINKALYSSDKEDWETPQALFDELNKEFNFVVDLAASEQNKKCPIFIPKCSDALSYDWGKHNFPGWCWCNPPYSRNVGVWVKKAYEEMYQGANIVMLIAARTNTKWFHDYILDKEDEGIEVRYLKGRLRFEVNGVPGANVAPFPSMLVIFRGQK